MDSYNETLAIVVILCALLSVGCSSDYDAGIEAYKRGHYTIALYDFDKRANQGDPVAQFCLGYMYQSGNGVAANDETAMTWYTRAAEKGCAPAQNNLAKMYDDGWLNSKGKKVDPDFKKAEELWKQAAEKGNRTAQANLGFVYFALSEIPNLEKIEEYLGIEKTDRLLRLEKAEELLKKSADQDLPIALLFLGELYNKKGQEAFDRGSPKLANQWYEKERDSYIDADKVVKAAEKASNKQEKGYAPAQNELGSMYYHGEGIAQSLTENERYKEAFCWYKQAADQDYAEAQRALAFMYHLGKGVVHDSKEAMKLWKKAAKQGNISAQNSLASMYANDQRTDELNKEMAARWWLRAAQQGDAFAQANIGQKFEIGPNRMAQDGAEPHDNFQIPQDNAEAYYWYSLALRDSDNLNRGEAYLGRTPIKNFAAKVTEWHESVGEKMRDERLKKIQERVRNWKPKKDGHGYGTSFYIGEHYILTNAHVVTYDKKMKKKYDEFRIPYRRVELIDWDPEVDLALLHDERGNTDIAVFKSGPVNSGDNIVSFGYPLSDLLSYRGNSTIGIVSGLLGPIDIKFDSLLSSDILFQHTAPILPGNSGGPLLDGETGNVVGVSTLRIRREQNANFAIKFEVIQRFLNKIKNEKNITVHLMTAENNRQKSDKEKFTVPVLGFKNKDDINYLHPSEIEAGTQNVEILELRR